MLKAYQFRLYPNQDQKTNNDKGQVVVAFETLGHVPGALLALAEAAQLHGLANDLDAVETGENQRQENLHAALDPGHEGPGPGYGRGRPLSHRPGPER